MLHHFYIFKRMYSIWGKTGKIAYIPTPGAPSIFWWRVLEMLVSM